MGILRKAVLDSRKRACMETKEIGNFENHLEEYDQALAANDFHVYECKKSDCDFRFLVSQLFIEQDLVKCPICSTDEDVVDLGSATVMMKGD
ncbi:hypothetical protein [Priestia aryabhattai]|uniref:hypothetical protein n=1 Tax=Priestia aryabhattai TaxID=412384 RepID=UPI003CA6B83C